MLLRVKSRLGFTGVLEALGVTRGSLHNYLSGVMWVLDCAVEKALRYLGERGFYEIVQDVGKTATRVSDIPL